MLAINSILKNHTSDTTYNFYIVESDLSDKNKTRMKKYVEENGQKIQFINIDPDVIVHGKDFYASGYLGGRISSMGMVRILLPELLPESVHRVLYLDGDILVTTDLSELYNFDLKGNATGMVLVNRNDTLKLIFTHYNSGVILMDIDKWREEKISKQMLDYMNNNSKRFLKDGDKEPEFKFGDQNLFNIVLENKITTIPINWNFQVNRFTVDKPNFKGIFHYNCILKPWLFPRLYTNKRLYTKNYYIYYKYWNESPFRIYKYYYIIKTTIDYYIRFLSNLCYIIKNLEEQY